MTKTAQGKGRGEDDATSSLSSESVSNNCISQAFLQQVKGHYCSICCEQHYLTATNLATFETEAQCAHVYCYVSLFSRKTASVNGDLTCPKCMCIALNIIHHRPIRLDNGFPYQRNILQEVLGRSEGHFCSICHKYCKLRDTELETMDTTEQCTHVFCFNCLSTYKRGRIEKKLILQCPNCRAVSVDIIHHEKWPSNEVEVITNEPTDCCNWAMDTTLSTGIGN
jgi:hypothetical protein